jgi:hypothetical protein
MKIGLYLLSGALLLALNVNLAWSKVLTVNITASVITLDDPGNALNGQVAIGQAVNGAYRYETTVPDQNPDPQYGEYPQSPAQGSVSFSAGALVFASDSAAPNWMYRVFVHGAYDAYYQDYFRVSSQANKPLMNGASVQNLDIDFSDYTGAALSSDVLFTAAPDLGKFPDHRVSISGFSAAGTFYKVVLQINSAETVQDRLVISPSSGSFIRPQHIDPALLLQSGSQVSGVQASVNGIPLSPGYLQQCQVAPPNTQGRPALYCPDINSFLPPGNAHLEWRLQLLDGSTLTNTVDWEMIQ